MKKQPPAALILCLITLIAALALALTNAVTEEPIRIRAQEAIRLACESVISADAYEPLEFDENEWVKVVYAASTDGVLVGYAAVSETNGYGGPVEVTVGMNPAGSILGISVGGINFAETAGLGTKAREPAFTDQFIGRRAPLTLRVNVDAVSGATITSRAVVDAVNAGAEAIVSIAGLTMDPEPPESDGNPPAADVLSGSAKGFQSDVTVQITLAEDDRVTAVQIDAAGETEGFGTRLSGDEAFAGQFIGKSRPFVLGEGIDALAGATVSSAAAVEAINTAASGAGDQLLASAEGASLFMKADGSLELVWNADAHEIRLSDGAVSLVRKAAVSTATVSGNTAESKMRGFDSNVTATVTVDDAGVITELVLKTGFETEYFGAEVEKNTKFIGQFIGLPGPFELGADGIDAVTGSTVTSRAVVEAINDCLLGLVSAAE